MRLIDADALKKLMEEECCEECAICCYANSGDGCRCNLIDNAPTVECVALTEEAYSDLCLRASRERQKGEWVLNKDENPECPFCHHSFTDWGNFCGNCGADMKGANK